jgi:hypothetical protein
MMQYVSKDTISTIRVRVLALASPSKTPIWTMTAQLLGTYRGSKPHWKAGKFPLAFPPCSPPAVEPKVGSDLVLYEVRSEETPTPFCRWTTYLNAKTFDSAVR